MKLRIGIDPDTDKSGVAIKNIADKTFDIVNMTLPELIDYLQTNRDEIAMVRVEGGWLHDKSNFHKFGNERVAARIGKNVGANHQTGKHIVEFLNKLQIPHEIARPLTKRWKGRDGKISHNEFNQLLFQSSKQTLKHSNQEMRDAFLLIV